MLQSSVPNTFSPTVVDQAHSLRSLAYCVVERPEPSLKHSRLWLVLGGKNGVGTTTAAWNIALSAVRNKQRTILLDADARGNPEAAAKRLLTFLDGSHFQADVVVLDTGHGNLDFATAVLNHAEKLILVTTCDATAVVNTFQTLKWLVRTAGKAKCRYYLAVNQAGYFSARNTYKRLSWAARRLLGVTLLPWGQIPKCSPPLKLTFRLFSADNIREASLGNHLLNWRNYSKFFDLSSLYRLLSKGKDS